MYLCIYVSIVPLHRTFYIKGAGSESLEKGDNFEKEQFILFFVSKLCSGACQHPDLCIYDFFAKIAFFETLLWKDL